MAFNRNVYGIEQNFMQEAASLNSQAPQGESLAFINPEERNLLKQRGGSGDVVPGTGIQSYDTEDEDKSESSDRGFSGGHGDSSSGAGAGAAAGGRDDSGSDGIDPKGTPGYKTYSGGNAKTGFNWLTDKEKKAFDRVQKSQQDWTSDLGRLLGIGSPMEYDKKKGFVEGTTFNPMDSPVLGGLLGASMPLAGILYNLNRGMTTNTSMAQAMLPGGDIWADQTKTQEELEASLEGLLEGETPKDESITAQLGDYLTGNKSLFGGLPDFDFSPTMSREEIPGPGYNYREVPYEPTYDGLGGGDDNNDIRQALQAPIAAAAPDTVVPPLLRPQFGINQLNPNVGLQYGFGPEGDFFGNAEGVPDVLNLGDSMGINTLYGFGPEKNWELG